MYTIKLSWSDFKSICIVDKMLAPQYVIVSTRYRLFAIDSNVVYECHPIEASEILEFETYYKDSFNKRIDAVDEDGNVTSAFQTSIEGIVTWIISDNLCSASLPSADPSFGGNPPAIIGTAHENGGIIVFEWAPSPSKKLYVVETQLVGTPDINLNSAICHFIGTNTGKLGDKDFDRIYTGEWGRYGYRVQGDSMFQDSNEKRIVWDYVKDSRPPIILKSAYNAKITLTRTGPITGTEAYVKLKVISLDE